MIIINEMTNEELKHYQKFSYENFLSETAKSSEKSIDQIKSATEKPITKSVEEFKKIDSWLVIKMDNQNIGYIWIQFYPEKNEAFGYDIFIDENFRSKGIGREVMLKCSENIKSRYNIKKVKICVFHNNTIARRLYDSLGFKEESFDNTRKQYTLELAT